MLIWELTFKLFKTVFIKELTLRTVSDIVAYNKQDSLDKIPYGQGRFEKILTAILARKS
jgi:amidase